MSEHTPGPWMWRGNLKQRQLWLCTPHSGTLIVMDFVRWGMGGAQPRFRQDGVMRPAEMFVEESDHNNAFHAVDHPDARLIAQAPELLERCAYIAQRLETLIPDLDKPALATWVEGTLRHLVEVARGDVRPEKYERGERR